MDTDNFRELVAQNAHNVMTCAICIAEAPVEDLPQPGWLGNDYEPGKGIVFVMQNPGKAPFNYGPGRDAEMRKELRTFSDSGTLHDYERLSQAFLRDANGTNSWRKPWPKWTHPVSKIVENAQQMAWLNVVKFRTIATVNGNEKNAPLSDAQVRHGINNHLIKEIETLNPAIVVAIGSDAFSAVSEIKRTLRGTFTVEKLHGMSPSEIDAQRVKMVWKSQVKGR